MTSFKDDQVNPATDLTFSRTVDATPEQIWAGWTQPEILKKWFCPLPWVTTECDIDLRPGGGFRTVMQSPEGQKVEGIGCYLETTAPERLVWTSALQPGFRPVPPPSEGFVFAAIITFERVAGGTKYSATVKHASAKDCESHNKMGFHVGWNAALDQLLALIKAGGVASC